MLNKTQKNAYELIQSDARFVYSLTVISQNARHIDSNYILMSLPYVGVFADGAEQWCKKAKLEKPQFNEAEKSFYAHMRQGHKILKMGYEEFSLALSKKLAESECYFYNNRSLLEKVIGYYNVGTDVCNGKFCGNTLLCALNVPDWTFNNENIGPMLRDMSVVAGKLAASLGCKDFPPFLYNDNLYVTYKDFHFFKNSPLKIHDDFGVALFSILCNINYAVEFIENYFVEEIPQKFKIAYLQYYYLCDFIKEMNLYKGTNFMIDDSLVNRDFRNCIAHYGLGQFMREDEIMPDDILKGLTYKAFKMDYQSAKAKLHSILKDLETKISQVVLK